MAAPAMELVIIICRWKHNFPPKQNLNQVDCFQERHKIGKKLKKPAPPAKEKKNSKDFLKKRGKHRNEEISS